MYKVVNKPVAEICNRDVKDNYSNKIVIVQDFRKRGKRVYLPVKCTDGVWRLHVLGFSRFLECDDKVEEYPSHHAIIAKYASDHQSEVFMFKSNVELFQFIATLDPKE